MRKIVSLLFFVVLCVAPSIAAADGATVSSTDLIERGKDLDAHRVDYTGEVIGDILWRGSHAWINVSDGVNAIGVWVESGMLQDVYRIGRYDTHGDTVKVTGTYHRACAEHGGDFDIHAETLEVVEKGTSVSHPVDRGRFILAIVLAVCAVACLALVWRTILRKNQAS